VKPGTLQRLHISTHTYESVITLNSSSSCHLKQQLFLLMNVLFEFQSNWTGSSHDSVQSRRVVISHNMDKALKEGES